jgi:hypothetical protein
LGSVIWRHKFSTYAQLSGLSWWCWMFENLYNFTRRIALNVSFIST